MKVTSVNLETVCGITSKLPENDKLEVAFAGRSNVGKSSLINALMNRKTFIILMNCCILLICRDMVMRKCHRIQSKSGGR